jgi:hypothetical protein
LRRRLRRAQRPQSAERRHDRPPRDALPQNVPPPTVLAST